MYPYDMPEATLEFLLDEQGLQASDRYESLKHRAQLMQAAINALYQLMTLSKE